MSLASLERRIADLEQHARQNSARRKFLSREEGLRLLARKIEEHEAERAAFEALPVPEKIETLKRKLAERIAEWASGESRPDGKKLTAHNEILERHLRRHLEIQILELEGASAESVRAMRERNDDAVRKSRGLSWADEGPSDEEKEQPRSVPRAPLRVQPDPVVAPQLRPPIDKLKDYRGPEDPITEPELV
jgi:hypothetical protein